LWNKSVKRGNVEPAALERTRWRRETAQFASYQKREGTARGPKEKKRESAPSPRYAAERAGKRFGLGYLFNREKSAVAKRKAN